MAIDWTDVTDIAPALSAVPEDTQTAILADVSELLDETYWGTKYDLGSKYLAAHMGTMYLRGASAGGPVASESLGDASISYAVMASTDSLMDTPYGRAYRNLTRMLPGRFGVLT